MFEHDFTKTAAVIFIGAALGAGLVYLVNRTIVPMLNGTLASAAVTAGGQ